MTLPKKHLGFGSLRKKAKSFAKHYFRISSHPIRKTIDEPHRLINTPGTFGVEIYTDVIEMNYDYFIGSSKSSRKNIERGVEMIEDFIYPSDTAVSSPDLSWYFN